MLDERQNVPEEPANRFNEEAQKYFDNGAESEMVERVREKRVRTLYEISADYTDIEQLLDSIDDDITPEDAEKIAAFMQDLEEDRDQKLENYGGLIKSLEYRGEAQVAEGKRIQRLGEVELNKAKFLKGRVLGFFQLHNITDTIKTLRFKFRRQKNGGKAPLVVRNYFEEHPEEVPEQFVKLIPVIDREGIRHALEGDNEELKALLEPVAFIDERGEHLRIS